MLVTKITILYPFITLYLHCISICEIKKKQLLNEIDNAVALLTKYKDSALDLDYFENSVVFAFGEN